jgi:DNA repair photolyase
MTTRRTGKDAETPLFKLLPPTLPVVERISEPKVLLKSPGPSSRLYDVLELDYLSGCGHGCPFCPARVGSDGRVHDPIRLVADVADRLTEELLDLPRRPRAVLVSPSTDPFPPLADIQAATSQVVEVLARHGIEAWLMTRGFIRPSALDVLRVHANRVKVTVSLTTLDRALQRALEPLTAPPRLRLKTIQALRAAGVACNAALEPLIPGVTDTRENLMPVLEALAIAGIRQVSVGYLVLTRRNERHLQQALRPMGLDSMVWDEYAHGPMLRSEGGPSGRYLPRSRRQHGYAVLMAMAAGLGMRISVNALTNPDFIAEPADRLRRNAPMALQASAR